MFEALKRGRESYRRRAWADAYESLSLADRTSPLAVDDLELLAVAAYMVGRDDDFVRTMDRAHHTYLDVGKRVRAARCGFWLGLSLLLRDATGPATGWLARAQRLVEGRDCVERGYLLLPVAEQHLGSGDHEAAHSTASDAASIGERFGDADLVACARHLQGRALILRGQVQAGLAHLDEAMVAVTAGELSPIFTGLIYCSVIETCQQSYTLSRALEWTTALAKWCAGQPEMVAFTATCLVHRAEILQWHGDWLEAIEETRRACARRSPPPAAFYRQAELHRLRGDWAAAEEGYRKASLAGREPQPGLALLRLAQGRSDAAAAAIRRVMKAASDALRRLKLLPAYVEIMLAADEIKEATGACSELEELARRFDTGVPGALAAHARGAVQLAAGDAEAALRSLHRARQAWQKAGVPYETARARVLLGLACRALGDREGSRLELDAARAVFEQLGCAPDLTRLDSLTRPLRARSAHGLTPRELQVLRLVATGKTNKAIAAEMSLSEKTVDRHVSNILTKLGVSSRTAATAYAYEHDLI